MSKVSAIMGAYNAERFIAEAIESVLAQSYQDFELIVINDGSTDNTASIIEYYQSRYPEKIIAVSQENQGLCQTRNRGFFLARGEYIGLCDSDDRWLRDRLKEEVAVLDANPAVALVYGDIERITENGDLIEVSHLDPRYASGRVFDHLLLRKIHISCQTVLFRKSCLTEFGLFDPELGYLGCEDRDLWLRITRKYEVRYIPKALACYRMHPSGISRNIENMQKAQLYVVNKHLPESGRNFFRRGLVISRIFKEAADQFLERRDYRKATIQYAKAIQYWPWSVWPWVNWGKALVGMLTHRK